MLRVTFRTLASASTKARYAFYTVCLVNSVLVGVWLDLAISGNPSTSKIVGTAVAITFLSAICMIALLIFNKKESEQPFLTRISTYLSALLIVLVMVGISIPLIIQIPHQCNANRSSKNVKKSSDPSTFWCAWIRITAVYALVVALIASLMASFIHRRVRNSKLDMKACLDERVPLDTKSSS